MPFLIVVIDDEEIHCDLIPRMIRKICEGCRVVSFTDPASALADIKDNKPGLVITDMVMPSLRGGDVLREVKAIYPDVPVVGMTGYSKEDFSELDFDGFLLKPFHLNDLANILLEFNVPVKI
jgi:CheY-like chemotaxis protein